MSIEGPTHDSGSAPVAAGRKRAAALRRKRRLSSEDAIVVIFVLFGLVGSVVLYRTNIAPIIVSFFLAIGVAALVYRFLGGIEDATLVWGALKIGGTMAVLVGIAIGVNRYLEVQSLVVLPPEGTYDWQWAEGGWSGYLQVNADGSADIQMDRFITCGSEKKKVSLLKKDGDGSVEAIEHLTKFRVRVPVRFADYNPDCTFKGWSDKTTLEGILIRKLSFAGDVRYHNQYGSPIGGIVLVRRE